MTIKVYISGICGSHEVRKHQQRVLFILQGLPIDLQVVDITEPGRDEDLIFMQEEAKKHDKKTQLPPQIFNEGKYCGDYMDFELANDDDEIMRFLKLEESASKYGDIKETTTQNGISDHANNQENSEVVEETNVNIIQENNVDNDEDVVLNELESKNEEVKVEEIIETSINEDAELDNQDEPKSNKPEEENVDETAKESEEESD